MRHQASTAAEDTLRRMAELRSSCAREVSAHRDRTDAAAAAFRNSLSSLRSASNACHQNRDKLGKLKDYLKGLEAELLQTLSVKASKNAKQEAITESMLTTIARIEELEEIVQGQGARKDEYATIIDQQLQTLEVLEEKINQEITERRSIEEAVMWYKRVLGFRTEGGEGVKFVFGKIDSTNPDQEYSFTIRLNGDIYTLLHCEPYVENLTELINELNKSNGLFKFARIMREKFQAAALMGISATTIPVACYADSFSVNTSSPPPVSVEVGSERSKAKDLHLPSKERQRNRREKVISGVLGMPANPSPRSVSALRRSPRIRARGSLDTLQ